MCRTNCLALSDVVCHESGWVGWTTLEGLVDRLLQGYFRSTNNLLAGHQGVTKVRARLLKLWSFVSPWEVIQEVLLALPWGCWMRQPPSLRIWEQDWWFWWVNNRSMFDCPSTSWTRGNHPFWTGCQSGCSDTRGCAGLWISVADDPQDERNRASVAKGSECVVSRLHRHHTAELLSVENVSWMDFSCTCQCEMARMSHSRLLKCQIRQSF